MGVVSLWADFTPGPRAGCGLGCGGGRNSTYPALQWWKAWDAHLGRVPQAADTRTAAHGTSLEASLELRGLSRVADNAQQQYVRHGQRLCLNLIKRAKG